MSRQMHAPEVAKGMVFMLPAMLWVGTTPSLAAQEASTAALLAAASEEVEALGFEATSTRFAGRLGTDATAEHFVTLDGRMGYAVVAACGAECSDVDAFVYDQAGRQLTSDIGPDGPSILRFETPKSPSRYRVRVRLYRCSTAPCEYGVRILRSLDSGADGVPGGYEGQVLGRLHDAAAEALDAAGFEAVGVPQTGTLDQGADGDLELELGGEGTWAVLGVCDEDCTDVDLSVHDRGGDELVADREIDSEPLVYLTDEAADVYRVNVRMYRCSTEPCYYAVGVYRSMTTLEGRSEDAVRSRLVSARQRVLPGVDPEAEAVIYSGTLSDDESEDVYVPLQAGREYSLLAVCDEICEDVDLFVSGPDDEEVASDIENDAEPTVTIVPASTGEYRVRVRMWSCPIGACHYALGVYER